MNNIFLGLMIYLEVSHAFFDSQANEPAKLAVLDTMKIKVEQTTLLQPLVKGSFFFKLIRLI
jgi:hypothetical protein